MANVRFNLKNKSEKETLVVLIFRYDNRKFVYSTGQKIEPKFWNDNDHKAKETLKFPGYSEFNNYLSKLEYLTQNIYRGYLIENKNLTPKEFKKELDIALEKEKRKEKPNLMQFIEDFIENREQLGKPKGSLQVYRKTLMHLKDYSAKYGAIDYEDINTEFLGKFQRFLYSPPKSLSNNYTLKLIQNLKLFLNEAYENGYNTNTAYKSRKFTIKKELKQKINDFFNLQLINNEHLEFLLYGTKDDIEAKTSHFLNFIEKIFGYKINFLKSNYNEIEDFFKDKINFDLLIDEIFIIEENIQKLYFYNIFHKNYSKKLPSIKSDLKEKIENIFKENKDILNKITLIYNLTNS